jgi:hypothetical protein
MSNSPALGWLVENGRVTTQNGRPVGELNPVVCCYRKASHAGSLRSLTARLPAAAFFAGERTAVQVASLFAMATNNLVNKVAVTTVSSAVLLTLLAIKHF